MGAGSRFGRTRIARAALAVLVVFAALPTAAQAVVPGANGRIAFRTFVAGDTGSRIATMNPDGSDVRFLSQGNQDTTPAWSPDATKLAFGSQRDYDTGSLDVYATNADGTNVLRLTTSPFTDAYPTWSPDGSKIAFASQRDGIATHIYVMNADGSNQVQLTTGARETYPTWSPDGTRIAYLEGPATSSEIRTVHPDGTGDVPVLSVPGATRPSWSPGGSKLAYGVAVDGVRAIHIVGADGSGDIQLTHPPDQLGDWFPAWSPDGTRIAFNRQGASSDDVYTIGVDGSGETNITAAYDPGAEYPDWGVAADTTPPTLTFAGNTTYTVDQHVSVTCTATDSGSGLALPNPCASPLVSGPAWTFPLGSNAVGPVTARDKANNATTKSTSFTVTVTPKSLCTLTKQLVQGSAKYLALKPALRSAIDALWSAACSPLNSIVAKLKPAQKTALVNAYKLAVDILKSGGWLTAPQATSLKSLAGAL